MPEKPLKDWTFEEILAFNTGQEIVAIGEGKFKEQVYFSANRVLQWRHDIDEEERKKNKRKKKK